MSVNIAQSMKREESLFEKLNGKVNKLPDLVD